jgi:hypothetical protein
LADYIYGVATDVDGYVDRHLDGVRRRERTALSRRQLRTLVTGLRVRVGERWYGHRPHHRHHKRRYHQNQK